MVILDEPCLIYAIGQRQSHQEKHEENQEGGEKEKPTF